MIAVSSFEDEIALLEESCMHGLYEYSNLSESFRACTTAHFRGVKQQERYGVYMVRQRDTQEVLYIGKGGTINSEGQFGEQDVPGRLKNVKQDNVGADEFFKNLVQDKGALVIHYIFLSTSKSPALVEAVLLQAYMNEHHCLPCKNKTL